MNDPERSFQFKWAAKTVRNAVESVQKGLVEEGRACGLGNLQGERGRPHVARD